MSESDSESVESETPRKGCGPGATTFSRAESQGQGSEGKAPETLFGFPTKVDPDLPGRWKR